MSRIVENQVEFEDGLWEEMPHGKHHPLSLRTVFTCINRSARDLVGQLLIHNPKHRETVKGALASHWIISELELLKERYRDRIGSCP